MVERHGTVRLASFTLFLSSVISHLVVSIHLEARAPHPGRVTTSLSLACEERIGG
jgi:hypothetical protein